MLPGGADWLQTSVAEFVPGDDAVKTANGKSVRYDYLVVATGMQAKWGQVKGLMESLGDGRVVSNMSFKVNVCLWRPWGSTCRGEQGGARACSPVAAGRGALAQASRSIAGINPIRASVLGTKRRARGLELEPFSDAAPHIA